MPKKAASYRTTAEIGTSDNLIEQVIGQDEAVDVIRKAAKQRRHVLLIGEPGTGKSMLGLALADMLPKEKLVDVLAFHNPNDENQPLVRTVPAGQGRQIVLKSKLESQSLLKNQNILIIVIFFGVILLNLWAFNYTKDLYGATVAAILSLGGMLVVGLLLVGFMLMSNLGKKMGGSKVNVPKVIVDNFKKKKAPFFDATGSHAGALLGDVLHDPFQSGGLGTPANERVVAGMIHKAHMGVLFIDEIATLEPSTQQELLTCIQEGKYAITGQSERSAGAMVRTEPVPCTFIMVAAGNIETVKHMHPALRSRIRGYGYEIYMKESMPDTVESRMKIAQFVAQEVRKDGKIPHFSKEAVDEILFQARKRANRKGHITLRLRELGGLVRAAGDIALEAGVKLVAKKHVIDALQLARTLEQQIADQFIERKKEYEVIMTKGKVIGRVNGMAVIGSGSSYSGIILPIEAEITVGEANRKFIATGKLGEIAKEAVTNVSAIIKRIFGQDLKKKDVFVQFLQTYEGVEGDSASIAVAVAIVSALTKASVKQDYAITGSLSVRGESLPIGGISSKIEAAVAAGIKHVIVPRANMQDITLNKEVLKKVKIIPVKSLKEVLKVVIDWKGKTSFLRKISRG